MPEKKPLPNALKIDSIIETNNKREESVIENTIRLFLGDKYLNVYLNKLKHWLVYYGETSHESDVYITAMLESAKYVFEKFTLEHFLNFYRQSETEISLSFDEVSNIELNILLKFANELPEIFNNQISPLTEKYILSIQSKFREVTLEIKRSKKDEPEKIMALCAETDSLVKQLALHVFSKAYPDYFLEN